MGSNLLSIGVSAMFANQEALNTVGQNIANANTPGYSRQQVVLSTPAGQYTGSGFMGQGVTVQTVTREYNGFLTTQAQTTAATSAMDQTHSDALSQLEKIFPTGANSLGTAVNSFLNSMQDVSSSPSDASARQVVLGQASSLAAQFSSAGQQINQLQTGVVSDLTADVSSVNQLTQQIAAANTQIAAATGSGQPPNDLLDKRDQLITQLSQYVGVTTLPASDGSVGVFIGGGQQLVLGGNATQLAVVPDAYNPSRAAISISDSAGTRTLNSSLLSGGSITGRLQFQNSDLVDASDKLGQIAAALSSQVNGQQALGLNLSDPPGTGAPIFSVTAPIALPASSNARNSDGTFATSVGLTVTDATQLQASDYNLKLDPAGSGGYQLTRLSDGLTRIVQDGDTVDGFQINLSGAPMASTDSFMLEPVSGAAAGMQTVLSDPDGIAAAAPLTATLGTATITTNSNGTSTTTNNNTNTGTLTVNSLYAVNSNLDTTQAPMVLTFGGADPDNAGQVLYTLTMADGSTVNGSWAAGQPIGNQPDANPPINLGFELSLNGVPNSGDTVTISPTQFTATNNGNAQAFLNLQTSNIVGKNLQPDGSLTPGTTLSNAYATAMSDIGSRVQGATYLAGISSSVATSAQTAKSDDSGVNVDEEAARLMQYQQGYQAAAKVLQTAQTLFDQLLQIAGSSS